MELSVIICTYNRSNGLETTLESLELQELPENFSWEVVVVDNNSTDDTPEKVRKFAANSELVVRYVKEKKQGLSYARNKGVAEARGRYLYFIDDDEIADKHLVGEIFGTFETYKCDCVGGRIYLKCEDEMPRWLTKDLWGFLTYLNYGDDAFQMDEQRYPFGGNMAFSREVFRRIGLFNVNMGRKGNQLFGGEEFDLFQRLLASGGKGIYQPNAIVYHVINKSRLKKNYFRTLHYKAGYQKAFYDKDNYPRNIYGIPLFFLPQLVMAIRKYFFQVVTKGPNWAFRQQMTVLHFLGMMSGYLHKKRNS